jgi:hypothetical protein
MHLTVLENLANCNDEQSSQYLQSQSADIQKLFAHKDSNYIKDNIKNVGYVDANEVGVVQRYSV